MLSFKASDKRAVLKVPNADGLVVAAADYEGVVKVDGADELRVPFERLNCARRLVQFPNLDIVVCSTEKNRFSHLAEGWMENPENKTHRCCH